MLFFFYLGDELNLMLFIYSISNQTDYIIFARHQLRVNEIILGTHTHLTTLAKALLASLTITSLENVIVHTPVTV